MLNSFTCSAIKRRLTDVNMSITTLILIIVLFSVLLVIIIIALDIARSMRRLAFSQERIMETFLVIQMRFDAVGKDWNSMAQYIYGLDVPRLLTAQKERERGQK